MAEEIRKRITLLWDKREPVDNIFSFKFRIRNAGKREIKEIPVIVVFKDKNTKILGIKETLGVKGKEREINRVVDEANKYREEFIVPGWDPGETATFDVFTKDNKTPGLESFDIKLSGKKSVGIQWTEKKEIVASRRYILAAALTATVATVIVAAIAVSVQKFIGGGIVGSSVGILAVIGGILAVLIVFSKPLR